MSQKITLPGIVAELALRSGETKVKTEEFVKALFSIISETLENGESVKVRGLGVFKVFDVEARKSVDVNSGQENIIPAHRKVTFVPVKELAAIVNSPFEIFHTIEIPEDITEELDDTASQEESTESKTKEETTDSASQEESTEVEESNLVEEAVLTDTPDASDISIYSMEKDTNDLDMEDTVGENDVETNEVSDLESMAEDGSSTDSLEIDGYQDTGNVDESQDIGNVDETQDTENVDDETDGYIEDRHETVIAKRGRFWSGFVVGIIVSLFAILCGWLIYRYIPEISKYITNQDPLSVGTKVKSSEIEAIDSINMGKGVVKEENGEVSNAPEEEEIKEIEEDVAPTMPSDAPVYDTITKTRYLTTMAKDHYGNYHLWPYIYIENQRILGHPNHIRPGTRVVIPDLKKYGVNAGNKEDIEKAKKKGQEIYSRFE